MPEHTLMGSKLLLGENQERLLHVASPTLPILPDGDPLGQGPPTLQAPPPRV